MKLNNNQRLIVGVTVAAVVAAGVTLYLTRKQRKQRATMLSQVAEEGYETAQDILFPLKNRRIRRRNFIPPYFRNRGRYGY